MTFDVYAPHPGLSMVFALPDAAQREVLEATLASVASPVVPGASRWRLLWENHPVRELAGALHDTPTGRICRLELILSNKYVTSDRVFIGDHRVLDLARALLDALDASVATISRGGTLGELDRRAIEALPRYRFEGAVLASKKIWPALAALGALEAVEGAPRNWLEAWPEGGGMLASRGWLEAGTRPLDDDAATALPWSLRVASRALPADDALFPVLVFARGEVSEDDITQFVARAKLHLDPSPGVLFTSLDGVQVIPSAGLRLLTLRGDDITEAPRLEALLEDDACALPWLWKTLGLLHLRSADGCCVLGLRDDGLALALLPNTLDEVDEGAAWMWPIIDAMMKTLPCQIFAAGHPWANGFELELADDYALLARREADTLIFHLEPGWFGQGK